MHYLYTRIYFSLLLHASCFFPLALRLLIQKENQTTILPLLQCTKNHKKSTSNRPHLPLSTTHCSKTAPVTLTKFHSTRTQTHKALFSFYRTKAQKKHILIMIIIVIIIILTILLTVLSHCHATHPPPLHISTEEWEKTEVSLLLQRFRSRCNYRSWPFLSHPPNLF